MPPISGDARNKDMTDGLVDTEEFKKSSHPAGSRHDGLVAPIALYPDTLVAQILGAATFPYEVVDAVVWLALGSG